MSVVSMSDDEEVIGVERLELPINEKTRKTAELPGQIEGEGLEEYLRSIERAIICEAIESAEGFVAKAAKQLGLKRQTLQYKLKKYNIQVDNSLH